MPPDDDPPPPHEDSPAPGAHASAHDSIEGALEELRDRLDDVEAVAHSAVMMALEGDEEETTTVEPREDPPKGDEHKGEPPPPGAAAERHSGLFW